VRTAPFWNYIYQVASKTKHWKAK